MHGGAISASSDGKGKGAVFSLSFDTVIPDGVAAPPPSAEENGGAAGLRILLVEDHEDTRRALSRLLATFGCVVTGAGSVSEAVELADRQAFDLLVSDIGLPDGSGTDVMRHVRDRHHIKGIAISGFGQDEDVRRSREAGFETHLVKPVNFQVLHDVIRRVTTVTKLRSGHSGGGG
jgi:CheY-like chemotaxis protein